MDAMLAENPRAVTGGNNPPEPTPYEKAEKRILDLWDECKLWLDGAVVDSEGLAEGIGTLLNNLRDAESEADKARVAENKSFDDGKAAVQAKYAPLIGNTKSIKGKTVLAIDACKKALAPWAAAKEAEREAAATAARDEADRIAKAAQDAIRATDLTNLAGREQAEELLAEAKKAERVASKIENTKTNISNAGGRAISLRTIYTHSVTDETAFAKYMWLNYRADMADFLYNYAGKLVASGKREIPGILITEEKRVV